MKILKLTTEFYNENNHLKEALDLKDGEWIVGKERGYGIAIIEINNLRFGIPLRSNFTSRKHNSCFPTVKDGNKGLDYSKAVLLEKDSYISTVTFEIPKEEYLKIQGKSHNIQRKFTQYVEKYIKGVTRNDPNILRHYQHSTLQNYHSQLGLET